MPPGNLVQDDENSKLEIQRVAQFLLARPDLGAKVGNALRQAIDEVIDGPRTGRFRIEDLEKTEKTYIGTKVEIILRDVLELERGKVMDCLVDGCEVDIKFSLSGGWMIPREATGHICLLVSADDNSAVYNLGLLRMTNKVLTLGSNQDGKRSVSAIGRGLIVWLRKEEPLPPNFLLKLPDDIRKAVMSEQSGTRRVAQLFRLVTGQLIPRSAIEQVGQQKDSLRRARQMKERLLGEGIRVLCATYKSDQAEFVRHGFINFKDDDWLSIRET